MALTYANIIDAMELELQDSTNAIFTAATDLDQALTSALKRFSEAKPYPVKYTFTTTAASKKMAIAAHHKYNLLSIGLWPGPYVEYVVDQNPEERRNFTIEGNNDYIVLEVDTAPTSALSVYVYLNRLHVLQNSIGTNDGAGAIDNGAGYAIGATTIHVDGLGNAKTVLKDTRLAITGDATAYTVTADVTTSADAEGEADVTITPGLAAAVLDNAVVTLSLHPSTLDWQMEEGVIKLAAGLAQISKANKLVHQAHTAITTIATAATAVSVMDARIDQAVTDIASGRAFIETVNIGEPVGGYGAYAQREIAAAVARISEARGSFDKAAFEMRIANAAAGMVAQGRALVGEGERILWRLRTPRILFSYPRV